MGRKRPEFERVAVRVSCRALIEPETENRILGSFKHLSYNHSLVNISALLVTGMRISPPNNLLTERCRWQRQATAIKLTGRLKKQLVSQGRFSKLKSRGHSCRS